MTTSRRLREKVLGRTMSDYKFKVELESWSGHGEGGTIARVVLDKLYGSYHSTPGEIAEAESDANSINALITEVKRAFIAGYHCGSADAADFGMSRDEDEAGKYADRAFHDWQKLVSGRPEK